MSQFTPPPYGDGSVRSYAYPAYGPDVLERFRIRFEKRLVKRLSIAFFWCVVLHLLFAALLGLLFSGWQFLFPQIPLGVNEQLFSMVFYFLAIWLPFSWFRSFAGHPASPSLNDRPQWSVVLSGTGISLGISSLGWISSVLILSWFDSVGMGPPNLEMPVPNSPLTLGLSFISVCILPAVIEELIFRKAVMGALQPFGNHFAVIVSAFLFGIYHGNMGQFPYSFVLGLCLGYFVLKTNSVYTGMFIHFINNMISWMLDAFSPYLSDDMYNFLFLGDWVLRILLALFAMLFLIFFKQVRWRFPKSKAVISEGQALGTYIFSAGGILTLIVFGIIIYRSFT